MRLADLKPTPRRVTGPGTSTSDSVPAQVAETGEPLLVSNQERILSAKQEALLQQIAQLLGFDSVDALLEAGTGEPVGPTIKGGKKAAANGMGPDGKPVQKEDTGYMRTFNPATDDPANVAKARAQQMGNLVGIGNGSGEGPKTFTQDVMDTAAKDAQAGWDQGGAAGVGKAAGAVVRGAIGAIPAAFYDVGKDIVTGPVGSAVGGFFNGVFGSGGTPAPSADTPAAAAAAAASTAPTQTPAAKQAPGIDALSPLDRSNAAFKMGQEIDAATGTKGAELSRLALAPLDRGSVFGTMQKRFDAYANDPALLDKRNAREDMLGSGIRMEKDANGQMLITNTGRADGAVPGGGGASTINMAEGNERLARANAVRQSLIDSQRGSVGVIGGGSSTGGGDLLAKMLTPHAGAPNGQLTANQLNAARGLLADQQSAQLKGAEIAQRGDEAGQRSALEAARLAQGLPAMEGQQLQNEQGRLLAGLQKKAIAGDQQALSLLQTLGGKEKTPRYTTNVVHGAMGQPSTLVVTGPDGQPVMVGTGDEIAKRYAQQSQAAQVPPPEKRSVGTVYQTPKGPMVWRGNGWEAA